MKIIKTLILLTFLATIGCSSDDKSETVQPQPVKTTIYLIRHAEKADASADPNLSSTGLQRADNWALILKDVPFDATYSTNYKRTIQTAQPTATSNQKQVTIYDPANFSLTDVVNTHKGKIVFIVGHSNTIPPLINTYVGSAAYPDMTDTEYGNLYKITIVDGVITHGMSVHN